MTFDALDHIGKDRFLAVVFRYWWGREFEDHELRMLEALLIASFDHEGAPSVRFATEVAQLTKDVSRSVAAGLLTMGSIHGGAVAPCARLLQSDESSGEIVRRYQANGKRIPGLGHRLYKEEDPRSTALFVEAKKLEIYGVHCQKILALQAEVREQMGKQLAINIDGCMAALLSDLKIPWNKTNELFMWGRSAGMIMRAQQALEA